MSAQLDRGGQRPSHCLTKTLLAHALASLSLSRFCGLRGSSCTLVILDRAPALAQGTERLGPTLSRAMTLYSPRPPRSVQISHSGRRCWKALSRCGQALYDPSAGLPRRECSLGVGVRFPVAGRRRITRSRAPAVVEHLVSSLRILVSVSSPRLHARVASRAAPALAPPLPHHTRPPLSSARHLLPLAFGRHRGLKTVDFWGRRKVRPRALPQPRPRSPFEQPYRHCG